MKYFWKVNSTYNYFPEVYIAMQLNLIWLPFDTLMALVSKFDKSEKSKNIRISYVMV